MKKISKVIALITLVTIILGNFACGGKKEGVEYNPLFGTSFSKEYAIEDLAEVEDYVKTPYSYSDTSLFSGKRITKIEVPVKSVSAIDDKQYFTLYVLKKELVKKDGYLDENLVKEHKIYLPKSALKSTEVNAWVSIDLKDQFIYVASDETLAFMNALDTAKLYVLNDGTYNCYTNLYFSGVLEENKSFLCGVYADDLVDLTGKRFSILGASTCTFNGISNDFVNTNSTIGNNRSHYPRMEINRSDETWWMQAVESTGMRLLVNNSWSGSQVLNGEGAAYISRCQQLHDDTGENKGEKPDIIAVWMGINDFLQGNPIGEFNSLKDVYNESEGYVTPETIAEAYAIMIHKMKTTYEGAEVFLFTIAPNISNKDNEYRQKLNDTIKKIAKSFNCHVVDVGNIEGYTYQKYTIEGLHPNEVGMDLITSEFVSVLEEVYKR